MINVLITGGAGNIGSALAERLCKIAGFKIVVIDNLLTGRRDRLSFLRDGIDDFVCLDINDPLSFLHPVFSRQFDYVFHYAAVVGVERTIANPLLVLKDIEGLKGIFNFASGSGVKRIFFSSSSEVYGESMSFPQKEDSTPLNSRLPYSIIKNLGEAFCKSYKTEFDLDYTIFRFFNTFGPNQSTDFVLPRFVKLALRGEDLKVFGSGSQTRTFCYVGDNVDVQVKCLLDPSSVCNTLNVGSDIEISVLELARLVIQICESKSKIVFAPPLPEGDMSRRLPDISRMRAILGRDLISLETGISILVRSFNGSS